MKERIVVLLLVLNLAFSAYMAYRVETLVKRSGIAQREHDLQLRAIVTSLSDNTRSNRMMAKLQASVLTSLWQLQGSTSMGMSELLLYQKDMWSDNQKSASERESRFLTFAQEQVKINETSARSLESIMSKLKD